MDRISLAVTVPATVALCAAVYQIVAPALLSVVQALS